MRREPCIPIKSERIILRIKMSGYLICGASGFMTLARSGSWWENILWTVCTLLIAFAADEVRTELRALRIEEQAEKIRIGVRGHEEI